MWSVKALQSHTTALYRLSFTVSMATRALETCARVEEGQALQSFSITSSLTLLILHSLCYPVDWRSWWEGRESHSKVRRHVSACPPNPPHHQHHPKLFLSFFTQIHVWNDDLSPEIFRIEVCLLRRWIGCNFLTGLFRHPRAKCSNKQRIAYHTYLCLDAYKHPCICVWMISW